MLRFEIDPERPVLARVGIRPGHREVAERDVGAIPHSDVLSVAIALARGEDLRPVANEGEVVAILHKQGLLHPVTPVRRELDDGTVGFGGDECRHLLGDVGTSRGVDGCGDLRDP